MPDAAVEFGAIRWVVVVPPPEGRSPTLGPKRVVGRPASRVRAGAASVAASVGPTGTRRPWPEQRPPTLPTP